MSELEGVSIIDPIVCTRSLVISNKAARLNVRNNASRFGGRV